MRSIREMEAERARIAALSPEASAAHAVTLALHRHTLGLDPEAAGSLMEIFIERRRQIEVEGWTPEHDDEHREDDLYDAAGAYLRSAKGLTVLGRNRAPIGWPWEPGWWKPKDARSDLIRAGALCVAEAERWTRKLCPPQTHVETRLVEIVGLLDALP